MRKLLGWTGMVALLAALAAGAWLSWPILFPSLPLGWLSTLAKADAALLQNRPDLAKKALTATPEALPVSGWLQWEKRVHAVASTTGAWKWASEVARKAQAQYPGNADLAAYLVWTLLKDGQAKEAAALAGKVLPGTRWAGMIVQSAVEADGLASQDWSDLKALVAQPSEAAFAAYERLVALDPEPAVRKNALLTALSLGRLDQARVHLTVLTPEQRDLPPFDRLQGLMAYDQGDWSRAAALLKALPAGRPETLMVLADVYLHLGDASQARLIYDQMLADGMDDVSPVLLVNRATLALEDRDPGLALDLLSRPGALGSGPTFDRARLLVLEARFQLGEADAVRSALLGLLETGEETPLALEAELLLGRLFPDLASRPRLSSLLHRHPDFSPLAERLAWLLLVDQDYQGSHRVLDLHEKALRSRETESPWWVSLLRAYLFSAEDRLDEASVAFAGVPAAWRDATFFADWALVLERLAQKAGPEERKPFLEDSLEKLTRALDLLVPSREREALQRRSLWLTRKGELESSLVPLQNPARKGTLRSAATEDFRQAVQLDPENLRASFLLRQATVNQEEP